MISSSEISVEKKREASLAFKNLGEKTFQSTHRPLNYLQLKSSPLRKAPSRQGKLKHRESIDSSSVLQGIASRCSDSPVIHMIYYIPAPDSPGDTATRRDTSRLKLQCTVTGVFEAERTDKEKRTETLH
ncbi:hypothetical protein PoB_005667100 [Plakobranchus ocellatus]|uniref:Ig-like domain-containing protein n=1 Tax=Plakobranchus ocellatus TaxID=259542 RepID=A0AAV4CFL6_9GAST|nr:hypothetical protein PoB_005667100 [Plakobranchus ocellatus]